MLPGWFHYTDWLIETFIYTGGMCNVYVCDKVCLQDKTQRKWDDS